MPCRGLGHWKWSHLLTRDLSVCFALQGNIRDPDIWTVWCMSAHWPGSISRQCAGSSPSVARLSMDNSSSFSSQPRSFLFLLEPIRASTEKAWALELRAAADRLLSLISLKSTRRGGRGEKPTPSVQHNEAKQFLKNAHVSVYSGTQTHQMSKVIPTVTRNATSNF